MKSSSKRALALAICATSILAGSASAAIVNVSPGNMDGWVLHRTDSSVNYDAGGDAIAEMVNGPGTPPLGSGSAHFNTGTDGFQSGQLRNSSWAGTAISDLTSLSYSTYATTWNGQQMPYLTIWLSNGDRLWFEPDFSSAGAGNGNPNPQADPALNAWQTWDALNGMWYSDNISGPGSNAKTWAQILAAEGAGVTIINNGAKGGIRITSGFASSGDVFNAYVDAFTIGTAAGTTTYDFELAPIPEPTTVIAGALLLLPFGMSTLRMLRRNRQA